MDEKLLNALIYGLICGASLPLGALVALVWKPKPKVFAGLMAFGAGALIAALTLELVSEAMHKHQYIEIILGAIGGGVVYEVLNQILNNNGGFLRKRSTTISHLTAHHDKRQKAIFLSLSRIPIFHQLPPEEIISLIPKVMYKNIRKDEVIVKDHEAAYFFFIVEKGEVEIFDEDSNNKIGVLGQNDIYGAMEMFTGEDHVATVRATADSRIGIIFKEYFDEILETSPKLAKCFKELMEKQLGKLTEKQVVSNEKAQDWLNRGMQYVEELASEPTQKDIKEAVKEHEDGAPLAIWLGNLIDCIPESLVLGTSLIASATVSLPFLGGVFMANFPEALSASIGMREQKSTKLKIVGMWTVLMIITALGSMAGYLFFAGAPESLFTIIQGVAAGAILVMVAETMLPEAFHKGGYVTGLSTLFGFLAAAGLRGLETLLH